MTELSPVAAATGAHPAGLSPTFPRVSDTRQGVAFRVGGYISDTCLNSDRVGCGPRRHEATAQARTIQELSRTRTLVGISDKVLWEVAPDGTPAGTATAAEQSDRSCAPETVTKPPVDLLVEIETSTVVAPIRPPCPWRLDILVDDGPGNQTKVLEVKRWRGSAKKTVDDQLNAYVTKVNSYAGNPSFVSRDRELNDLKWSRGYRQEGRDGVSGRIGRSIPQRVTVPETSTLPNGRRHQ